MKNRPFLDIFLVILLVALVVANAWDFLFRADHPVASVVTSLLVFAALVAGWAHVFQKKVQ
jgi:membrane associated rhomboid family serine protease